jgi:uncharacterized protein (TIGR03435 family)
MPGGGFRLNPAAGSIFMTNTCYGMTMDAFAARLTREVSRNGVIAPVENKTGLEGKWDFDYRTTLQFRMLTPQSADNITVFDAIDKQLGLRLNPVQIPQDVLIVDKAEKPTPNEPGVAEALALKIPKGFDVATVRPVEPGPGPRRISITRGGGVNFSGMPLRSLILQAWQIDTNRLIVPPEMEESLRSLYSVIAKPPPPPGPAANSPAPAMRAPLGSPDDFEAAWMMMRALLQDRFKLALHREDRVLTAWKLVAAKPKIKKADPAGRIRMINGPAPGVKDPRDSMPARQRLFTFRNVTMDQFAERMPQIGLLTMPVINATGLEGAWDFTINFSNPNAPGQPGGGGRGGPGDPLASPVPEAAEPTGAITFPEALDEQLGLRLMEDKRPVSVWVIDHVEPKPTDN